MGDKNKEGLNSTNGTRPLRRHVSSEEKTWRTYSKSLIVELKEKLAERRARTLGLLSEGVDSSGFCEVDTESDGLDDTSSQSHEIKDATLRDLMEEEEPEAASLSETSSISDNMEFPYPPEDYTNRRENCMSPTRQCFFTTTATECHSFTPPRSDNTTMTSAKFRFEGDTELVSVGTECDVDFLNDYFLNDSIPVPSNGSPSLNIDSISLNALSVSQKDSLNKFSNCETNLNNTGADIDSIEATYSSAVEYFFGTSKDRPQSTVKSVSKPSDISNGSDKEESNHLNELELICLEEKENKLPSDTLRMAESYKYSPEPVGSGIESAKLIPSGGLEFRKNDFTSSTIKSRTFSANGPEYTKYTVSGDAFVADITRANQGAGDFKSSNSSPKAVGKSFCRSLIIGAEALLSSELSLTTYKCVIEEILRIIKSDNTFNSSINQNIIAVLQNAFDQNSFTSYVHQNVSSNSGSDETNSAPMKESRSKESDITRFQRNQRLQSCLKKARLVSALQLNHDSAVTKMGKVVTKQAYDKAVREFEALVTRFASTGLNIETTQSKHPHVTSLPPFGSNRNSVSTKTFIFDSKEKKESDEKIEDNTESKMKRSDTFVLEENSEEENEANLSCETSLKPQNDSENISPINVAEKPEKPHTLSTSNDDVSHSIRKPMLEKKKESVEKIEDNAESKMKRFNTFVLEENSEEGNEVNLSVATNLKLQSHSGNIPCSDVAGKPEKPITSLSRNNKVCHPMRKPKLVKRLPVPTGDESDSESGESHESGFCSNQVYTSTLLTQLLDYSSQEEDFGDLEESEEHERKEVKIKQEAEDADDPMGARFEELSYLIKTTENNIKEHDGFIAKTSGDEHTIVAAGEEVSHEDLDLVIYESDFETGSDSDTNFEILSTQKTAQAANDTFDNGLCNMTNIDVTASSAQNKDESSAIVTDIAGPQNVNAIAQDKTPPVLDSLAVQFSFDTESTNKADDHERSINGVPLSSFSLKNESKEEDNCVDKESKSVKKQFSPLRNSRQNLAQVDISSSDDDSADDITNELSPAEILRKRQIEEVDGKLEQLKEFAKRKRKSRYPHKQCLRNEERVEVYVDKEIPSDSDQTENHCANISQGYQDYKDLKLLSTCLDLLTRRRKMKNSADDLPICEKPSVEQREETVDTKICDTTKTSPVREPFETQAPVELTNTLTFDGDLITSTSTLQSESLPLGNSTNFSDVLSKSTYSSVLISNDEDCLIESKKIEFETPGLKKTTVSDNRDLDSKTVSCAEKSPLHDLHVSSRKFLKEDIFSTSECGSDFCIPNNFKIIGKTQNNGAVDQSEPTEACYESKLGKAEFDGKDPSKEFTFENKALMENTPTCLTHGTVNGHDSASVSTKHKSDEPSTLTSPTASLPRENITRKNIVELSVKIGDVNEISKDVEQNLTNTQIRPVAPDKYSSIHSGEENKPGNSLCSDFESRFSEASFRDSFRDETKLASTYNPPYKVCEVKSLKDSELQSEWQTIGSVNDFYRFLFESQRVNRDNRQRHVYCVCNPEYSKFSDFQHQTSSSKAEKNIEMTKIFSSEEGRSLRMNDERKPSFDIEHDGTDHVCANKINYPRSTRLQQSMHDIDYHIVGRLATLEQLLADCVHSQQNIEKIVREALYRQKHLEPGRTTMLTGHDQSDLSSMYMVPKSGTRAERGVRADEQSFPEKCHKLTDAATQTLTVVSQGIQTEETTYNETAMDLKCLLQGCMNDNFARFRSELDIMKSEMKDEADKYALETSRFDDLARLMGESNEILNKRSQDWKELMVCEIEALKNKVLSSLSTSVDAMKETVAGQIRSQLSDMLQTIRTDLASSLPGMSMEVNAVRQSLDLQLKMKEMLEASVSKKSGEEESQNPQIKKGVDVETMKMRIVELTSQRDAEKVFHKITRQSLRALERDHERLREEFLGARLRRDRRTQESDPRRQFQNFMSQPCSYCFNSNRPTFAQQKQTPKKQDKQKSSVKPIEASLEPNNSNGEKVMSEVVDTNQESECKHSELKDPATPETDIENSYVLEESS